MRAHRLPVAAALVTVGAGAVLAAGTLPAGAAAPSTAEPNATLAGYQANMTSAPRRAVSGSVIVPTVTCTNQTQSPLYISIGLFGTATRSGGTFDFATAGLTITCSGRTAFYQAEVSTNPERSVTAVVPGDRLSASLASNTLRTTVSLTVTRTGTVLRSVGNGMAVESVQATVQGGFENQTFPRMTAVAFSALKIDGAPLATFSPTAFDQVSGSTVLLASTPLAANGLGFKVKFQHQP